MATAQAFLRWIGLRRASIAVAFTAWVGIAVLAAGRGPSRTRTLTTADLRNAVSTGLAIVFILGVVALVILRPALPRAMHVRPRRSSKHAMLMLIGLVALAFALSDLERPEPTTTEPQESQGALGEQPSDNAGTEPTAAELVTIAVVLAVALGTIAWTRRGRTSAAELEEPDGEATLDDIVRDATELLRSSGEPRAAVLLAYASLEQSLAKAGTSRQSWETVAEYLDHTLSTAPHVAAPIRRLGELYELARFSDVEITEADRQIALRSLDAAQRAETGFGEPT